MLLVAGLLPGQWVWLPFRMCFLPPYPGEPCHLCSSTHLPGPYTITSNWEGEGGQGGVLGLGVSAMGDPIWSQITLEYSFSLLTPCEVHCIWKRSLRRGVRWNPCLWFCSPRTRQSFEGGCLAQPGLIQGPYTDLTPEWG